MADRQSFTPLQSRRLPQPVSAASLCPSMDLTALSFGGGGCGLGVADRATGADVGGSVASSMAIHRTVSWQKLLTVPKSELRSQPASGNVGGETATETSSPTGDDDDDAAGAPNGTTALCWSPDGRSVAVGLADGGVLLYDVESSVDGSLGGGGGGASGGAVVAQSLPPAPTMRPSPAPPLPDAGDGATGDSFAASASGGMPRAAARSKKRVAPCTTSPAVTRSMAAARRRQQIVQATTDRDDAGGDIIDEVGQGNSEVLSSERSDVQNLGWRRGAVTGLTWARVGPKHKLWELGEEEEEDDESWRYRSHYLDRAKYFLPPSDYNPRTGRNENQPTHHDTSIVVDDTGFSTVDRHRPTSLTPLSVLCVATCANGLHLYLHGRYRILSIPSLLSAHNIATNIVCTSGLSTILLSSKNLSPRGQVMSIYSIPSLSQHRYNLQQISALYCSITAHLKTIRRGLANASASWTSALRPLDAKFESLAKLLRDYGVLDASTADDPAAAAAGVRAELLRFVLEGHSSRTGDASNAMDQFFSAAVMNDQLLQRLERTLEANTAGVEGAVRKSVLGPLRALVYDAHELRGLVRTMNAGRSKVWEDEDGDVDVCSMPLMDLDLALQFCNAAEGMFMVLERCLSIIVDARFRLRDMMKWIRGTASHVKARGTAIDSVMRENARKRRVPDAVVRRVASLLSSMFLPPFPEEEGTSGSLTKKANLTEHILGVPLSGFFSEDKSSVPKKKGVGGFESPLGSRETQGELQIGRKQASSAQLAWSTTSHLAAILFDQPRNSLAQTLERIDISGPFNQQQQGRAEKHSIAVHKRVGTGVKECRASDTTKCFSPNLVQSDGFSAIPERHWILLAYSGSADALGCGDYVQILAFPCGHSDAVRKSSFYLETSFMLQTNCTISDLLFYGDDGCSSLTSAKDVDQGGEEGRQALGVLVERVSGEGHQNVGNARTQEVSEEIWICPYDSLPYRQVAVSFGSSRTVQIPDISFNADNFTYLSEEGEFKNAYSGSHTSYGISARRRQIREYTRIAGHEGSVGMKEESLSISKLVLSGSRGIGGIFSPSSATLDLFDIEEDEEDEEDEDPDESGDCDDHMSR